MITRIIGDIHGDYGFYSAVIADQENSIQVGDFGIGFVEDSFERSENHKFIRGNHDNPELCKNNKHWIPDGTSNNGIFCVGGGFSIDRAWRDEGIDWWPEEELSYDELYKVTDVYEKVKPDIMISHEAPSELIERMFTDKTIFKPHSRTSQALDSMFSIHQPKLWVFGHWHSSRHLKLGQTDFICLGINSFIDVKH